MSTASHEYVVAAPRVRRRAALGLLVSAQFVVMLDTSVVNVALPSIQRDLGLGPAGLAWVVNAYVLAFGGLLLLMGRAADVVGRRRMFVVGSAVLTAGSLLAGASSTELVLVVGRVVQGAGAAALSTAAMSLLLLMFEGPARAGAMSAWGAASTLGGATGVVLGGLLTGTQGWPWVFFVTVPVTAVAGPLALRLLARAPGAGRSRRFDGLAAVLATGGVLVLSHTALGLPDHGPGSRSVVVGMLLAAALLVAFALVERAAPDPLVPLEVFRSSVLTTGVVTAVLGGAARASTFVLVALYLQQVMRLAPQAAGLAMLPTSVTGFVASLVLLPRVLRRLGPERTMTVGLVVLALGHVWLARTPVAAIYLQDVLPGLLLVAVGVALSFTPTTMVIASALPSARSGLTSGLAGSATQVGSCLGLAAFTAVASAVSGAGGSGSAALTGDGFAAAFLAAAAVALTTALLAGALWRPRRADSPVQLPDQRAPLGTTPRRQDGEAPALP